jgi:hypothetical protein
MNPHFENDQGPFLPDPLRTVDFFQCLDESPLCADAARNRGPARRITVDSRLAASRSSAITNDEAPKYPGKSEHQNQKEYSRASVNSRHRSGLSLSIHLPL